jgi:hypothetical protein
MGVWAMPRKFFLSLADSQELRNRPNADCLLVRPEGRGIDVIVRVIEFPTRRALEAFNKKGANLPAVVKTIVPQGCAVWRHQDGKGATMNKTQELAALAQFIESLPRDSYLKDALRESAPFFSAAIRADVNFDFAGRLRFLGGECKEETAKLAKLRSDVKTAKDSLDAITRETAYARRELFNAVNELDIASNAIHSALLAARRVLKSTAA